MTARHESAGIAVVLLDYNGGAKLTRCLKSLAEQTVVPRRLIVIDNGGSSFDEQLIRSALGPRYSSILTIVRLDHNIGYAAGMNHGLRIVLDTSANRPAWVMTLSNDTELAPDFFENVGPFLREHGRVGMLAPKVKAMADRTLLDGAGISVSLDGMSTARGQRERDDGQYDKLAHVLVPNGVAAIYRTALLQEVGLLDESFWAYCEDTDIGLRAWRAGWDGCFMPECVVYHERSSTLGEHSLRKLYLVERNHYWVAIKNFPIAFLALVPLFTVYRYWVQAFALVLKKGQGAGFGEAHSFGALLRTTLSASKDALLGAPRAFFERRKFAGVAMKRPAPEVMATLWRERLKFSDLILK